MNKLITAEAQKAPNQGEPLTHFRITIMKDERYQLPPGTREVRVLSGNARLSAPEREYLMTRGEKRSFSTGEYASVSAESSDALLVLDMGLSATSATQERMKQMFYERMAARQQLIEAEERAEHKW